MPRKIVSKTSFLGGEAGYLALGRSDLTQFQEGAQRIQNFIVDRSGPATRRPGSRYVKATLSNNVARGFDFVCSYDDSTLMFSMEVSYDGSNLYFRMIRLSDMSVITPSSGATQALPNSINLNDIQYTQSADVMWLTCKGMPPLIVERTAAAAFTVAALIGNDLKSTGTQFLSQPYLDDNVTATTIAISGTSGSGLTATASAAIFKSAHIGSWWKFVDSTGVIGYFLITGFTDTAHVTCTIPSNAALANSNATTDWAEPAWSPVRGYPRTCTIYNQRVVFGGSDYLVDTFWTTETSNYFRWQSNAAATSNPALASDPQNYQLASDKLNEIHWMVGGLSLTIGTSTSEWVGTINVDANSGNLAVQFNEQTMHGSALVQAKKMGYTIPFCQRSRKSIRELVYNFYADQYVATDLTLFSSHIGTPYDQFSQISNPPIGVIQFSFSSSPFNILWAIDSVGRLYGLTRDQQQQVACWHSHVMGGILTSQDLFGLDGPNYPAQVVSIWNMPSPDGTCDRLWMIVARTINGSIVYQMEYIDDIKSNPLIEVGGADKFGNGKTFLDCSSFHYFMSPTASITGITRFESDNAFVVAEDINGNIVQCGVLPVSSGGAITLPIAAVSACVGLAYTPEIRGLPMEGGEEPKISQRSLKRSDQVNLRLHETFGISVGGNKIMTKDGYVYNETFEEIPFDNTAPPPRPTFTGEKELTLPTGNDTDGSYAITALGPWPCTILSSSARVVWNEV